MMGFGKRRGRSRMRRHKKESHTFLIIGVVIGLIFAGIGGAIIGGFIGAFIDYT